MPFFVPALIGAAVRAAAPAVARVAGPAIARAAAPVARAAASRTAAFVASRGGAAAVGRAALGAVAKTPALRAGAIGFGLGKAMGGGGQQASRNQEFDNWFPGSQDRDGTMY